MTDYPVSPDEWQALTAEGDIPGGLGELFEVECNVDPDTDFLQARRVGRANAPTSRAAVYVHHSDDMYATVYIAAAEARQLAAHLLNVADEIDGKTPLVFFPRLPNGEEAPEVKEPEHAPAGSVVAGDLAIVQGDSAEAYHGFLPGERVRVIKILPGWHDIGSAAECESASGLNQIVGLGDLAPAGPKDGN